MRVLLLADSCNPEWPSLPIVGYNSARALSNHADVVVATHIRNKLNIEKVGLGKARVRYIDNEYIARPMYRIASFLRGGTETAWTANIAFAYPSSIAFEWEVWKAFGTELQNRTFDIVHRLTPMSPTLPSPIATWSPVPFVLGPLNGGLKWPAQFRQELAREREWLYYLRRAYRYLPYLQSTYRSASAVLAAFQHTIDDLPSNAAAKTINFPEIGIDPDIFQSKPHKAQTSRGQKVILFAGRLVPYKLPQVVVRAFAERQILRSHRLVIVGDGPERTAIEQIVRNCGLDAQVQILGWRPQSEVAKLMREADIFAFPSIRELGAGALLEAMACGLACVVVDCGAPASLVDDDRGIKVPLGTADEIVRDFGNAFERLVTEPVLTARLSAAACEHAMQFYTWDKKAQKILAAYNWTLGRGPRPDFWSTNESSFEKVEAAIGKS